MRLACVLGALAVLAAPARAATTVQATCSTFGGALSGAGAGDTIVLTGMCTGADAHFTLPATAGLTIEGAATGTNGFDGTGVGVSALVSPPAGNDGITLANLTFENYTSTGPAVRISSPTGVGSSVTRPFVFDHDTFINDSNTASAFDGGGLSFTLAPVSCPTLTTADVTLSASVFTNDTAVAKDGANGLLDGGGGGAAFDLECPAPAGIGATANITGNTFSHDTVNAPSGRSRQGGGLWIGLGQHQISSQSSVTQTGNVFDHDSITGSGGSYLGGGEYTAGDNITSVGDEFVANTIPGPSSSALFSEGGGLATIGGGFCTAQAPTASQFTNLVATGNSIAAPSGTGTGAGVEGAGIYAGCNASGSGYHLTLTNSTISGNSASGTGAVAGVDGEATDSLVLQNSIVFGNSGGADVGGFGATDGANVTATFSDVCAIGSATAPFGGTGDMCADPALANVASADVHETASSPTIDAGSNALVPGGVSTDFYGAPRILAGKFGDAPTVDIGAAEFVVPAPVNAGLPVISGSPVEGQALTTTNGTWNGTTNAFTYQWQDCDTAGSACSNIAGATGNAYRLTHSDAGHTLRVSVTATNAGGSAAAISDKTATVIGVPTLSHARLAPASFTARKGTRLSFTLLSPATVRVLVTQTVRGHKVKGRCVRNARHGRRCHVTVIRSRRTLQGLAGANTVKLRFPHLAPGRYSVTVTARNSAGVARSVTLTFTIKAPAKRRHH